MRETVGTIAQFLCSLLCVSCVMGPLIWLSLRQWRRSSERSRQLLHRWAARRDLAIIDESRINPFFNSILVASNVQRIFEVTVRDAEGRTRRATVKCGHFLFGSLVGRVAAEWKDQSGPKPDIEIVPPDR